MTPATDLTQPTTAGTSVEMPLVPGLPGLRFRPLDLDADMDDLLRLMVACLVADGADYRPAAEDTRHDLTTRADFDLARDLIVGELDGRLVACAETHPVVRDGVVVHQTDCYVHPDVRRRGIGRAMFRWIEARSREVVPNWPADAPHEIGTWVDDGEVGSLALLASEGFRQIRFGFMMLRDLSEPIPDAPLPDGLEIRPVREADHRRIWEADAEAFRDHWDAAERTEADYNHWFTMPNLDTGLWRVAWDGDEVSGSCWNVVWAEENEQAGTSRGWLEHVSVRRPWRKRGLATALIADSLRAFRDLGLAEAALGVDSENPTGALRVYEALGFRRHRRGIGHRRVL